MRTCSGCGGEWGSSAARWCGHCGAPLGDRSETMATPQDGPGSHTWEVDPTSDASDATVPGRSPESADSPPGGERDRARRGRGWIAAGLVVAVGIALVVQQTVTRETTDQPPRSVDETPALQIVGDPVQTASGGGWSVRISRGEDDRWCVTAVRDATEPWGGSGEPCWEIAVPAGVDHDEPVTVLGRATESGEQLLVGSADRAADEGIEVTLEDGSTRRANAATFGQLPFLVWFVPLDGPIPTSVEAFSSTGSLGSVRVPEVAPPESVESISDTELQDLEFIADQEGISLDAAIVHYATGW